MNRTKAVMVNSGFAMFAQILNLVLSFAVRTMLIKSLGSEFNGLNGLFSNIINILSFAELGIGSAISFSLYKPLAEKNHPQIAAIMRLYHRIYLFVAGFIAVAGLILAPFLGLFIHGSTAGLGNIHVEFLLFVANVVCSYLMSYKRTILIANQEGYLDSLNRMVFTVMSQIVQILFLIWIPNYYIFLIVQLLSTFLSNVPIWHRVKSEFPYLSKYPKEKVDNQVVQFLKKNVTGMLSFKLGNIVITGTDNILLSSFMGLMTVGMYANYTLILNGLTSISNSVVNSITASIGNLANSKDLKQQQNVFFQFNLVNSILSIVVSIGLVTFLPVFIKLWIGEKYVFSALASGLIVFNFFILQLRNGLISYMNAYGLYWQQRYKSIFEALVNLVVSIILITQTDLGVASVLIGTLTSTLCVDFVWETRIVMKNAIHANLNKFLIYYAIQIVSGGVLIYLAQKMSYSINPGNQFFKGILVTVVLIVLCSLTFMLIEQVFLRMLSLTNVSMMNVIKRFQRS